MKIYNYFPLTGEFLTQSLADKSPLEKNVYLIPANATAIQPPGTEVNQKACFNAETQQWDIKTDYRGEQYFVLETRQPVIIDFLGDIPGNLVKELPELPTPEPTPQELKLKQALAFYNSQDLYLQAQFKPVKDAVIEFYSKDEIGKVILLLNSPYIPQELNELRQQFINILGE